MQEKLKPCKSVNAKTDGWGCEKPTKFRKFGLCQDCYVKWLFESESGQIHLQKSRLKAKRLSDKEKRKRNKKIKAEFIDYRSKLQTKVNELVRLIDSGQPCLATQKHAKQIHAGHVMSRGSQQSVRYNLHNIHRQSAQSNHFQNDDAEMREGLEREYGKGYLDFVLSLKQIHALKFNKPQYAAFYQIACSIVNEIRREGITFPTVEDRIEARNKYNIKLGIYRLKHSKYDRINEIEVN